MKFNYLKLVVFLKVLTSTLLYIYKNDVECKMSTVNFYANIMVL